LAQNRFVMSVPHHLSQICSSNTKCFTVLTFLVPTLDAFPAILPISAKWPARIDHDLLSFHHILLKNEAQPSKFTFKPKEIAMQKFIRTILIAAGFTPLFTMLPATSAQTVHFGAGTGLVAAGPGLPYPKLPPPPPPPPPANAESAAASNGPGLPYPKLPPPPPPPPPANAESAAASNGPGLPYPKLPPPPPPPPPSNAAVGEVFA